MKRLIIGGGVDILHDEHRTFYTEALREGYKEGVESVIFYLKTDRLIAEQKGEHRPYFTYSWRREDILSFLCSITDLPVTVKPYDSVHKVIASLEPEDVLVGRNTNRSFDHIENKVILIRDNDKIHSSDFLEYLKIAKGTSGCQLINVGGVLLRRGTLVAIAANDIYGNCSKTCPKYKEYVSKSQNGRLNPFEIKYENKCSASHTEAFLLTLSQRGDDLLLTHSPCTKCAEQIVDKRIRRVVYLETYIHTEGLNVLDKGHVGYRKAGLEYNVRGYYESSTTVTKKNNVCSEVTRTNGTNGVSISSKQCSEHCQTR